jgi:hypothetical protein
LNPQVAVVEAGVDLATLVQQVVVVVGAQAELALVIVITVLFFRWKFS